MKKTLCAFLFVLILPMANAFAACATNEIDVLGDGTQCEATKFSVTTTSDATSLVWTMTAAGTFYADCGDGGILSQDTSSYGTISGKTITRTSTSATTYTCTWGAAGVHTIRFCGTATGYKGNPDFTTISFYKFTSDGTQAKVASIEGSLGAMFPAINDTIPSFYGTFDGTKITSIPSDLFSGIDTSSSTNTSSMFNNTFARCTSLTSIPGNLFSGITTGARNMFRGTFYGCTRLTSIPSGLFSNITTGADYMFADTFYGCTNLAGYIPPGTFAGLIAAGHPTASGMWKETFANTQLATVCPAGTQQYITGYEGTNTSTTWSGKVSCEQCPTALPTGASWVSGTCNFTCDSGYINTGTACETAKFSVTTTSDATSLSWTIAASGTFYVDCGDSGILSQDTSSYGTISGITITRTSPGETTYTCTWNTAGAHTIRFSGLATRYSSNSAHRTTVSFYKSSGGTQDKVASISGSLGAIFPTVAGEVPKFSYTFSGTKITSIPAGLFSGIDTTTSTEYPVNTFFYTFKGCTGLTSIPGNLFSGIGNRFGADSFTGTFMGCTGLTSIPENLFRNVTTSGSHMFYYTFSGCTGLTSIPENLFSGITASAEYLFGSTFSSCTGLTSIPGNLFSRITTGASGMFANTFDYCTGLTSIPGNLFSRITTGASSMFYETFYRCNKLTSMPAGLFSGITTPATNMFSWTFRDCTLMSGYIPPTTFAGLIANDTNKTTSMWTQTFYNTQLATVCPAGTGQYITGFESQWGYSNTNTRINGTNRVSCEPCAISLPTNAVSWVSGTCNFTCENGYHVDNNACTANEITINWSNASAADIDANEAGTVTYGGDIRTPRAALIIPGKVFTGWTFSAPGE